MKFPHLKIGDRFEFQGRTYVKVGPLTAQDVESNQQRMIPRSVLVEPLGATPATHNEAPEEAGEAPTREALMRALAQCEQRCLATVETTAAGAIRNAFADCRQKLGL